MTAKRTSATALAACITLTLAACGGNSDPVQPKFSNFQPASMVLGQTDLTSRVDGSVAPTASSLSRPTGLALSPAGTLYVTDYENNRVLGFSGVPTANGAGASFVLGQDSSTSNIFSLTRTSQPLPTSLGVGAGKMVVSHYRDNRVVLFDPTPTASGAQPIRVFGQASYESDVHGCGADSLWGPIDAIVTPDGKVIVADANNNRILVWTSAAEAQPALVIGQDSLATCAVNDDDQDGEPDAAPTARTLSSPQRVWSDGVRLMVADARNHRVLIWNSFPARNFQPADLVLGQGSFTKGEMNDDNQDGTTDGHPSARTLSLPVSMAVDGNRLAIADDLNHRVLIWNSFPQKSFQPADVVLGQGSFAAGMRNDANQDGVADPGPSANTFSLPVSVLFHEGNLLVADSDNHRVLVFKPQR